MTFVAPARALGSILVALVATIVSAAAALAQPPFSKSFSPDTIGPGSTTTLTFVIDNNGEESAPVEDIAFTDILPAGLVIATPSSAITSCTDGILSAASGTGTISLTGARLGAFSACSVSVKVTGLSSGVHMNVSGDLTSSAGNSGTATADLTVDSALPGVSKSFSPSEISLGGTSTLTLLIENDNDLSLTSLSIVDNLPAGMRIASPSNAATTCTSVNAPATLVAASGTSSLQLFAFGTLEPFDPVLGASATCTVVVDVTTLNTGLFVNTTGELSSTAEGVTATSGFATAALDVPVEFLVKSFVDDPVLPGATVALRFTITNLDRDFPATDIAFEDDLDAALSDLVAVGLPLNDVCGAGSALTGTSLLSFTGGELAAGDSCTFTVNLAVPADAEPGTYPNVTGTITASIDGEDVVAAGATDNLVVSVAPTLTKEFLDDPVGAGDQVTLRFTIVNNSPDWFLADIEFTDDLETAIPGLAANGLVSGVDAVPVSEVCGEASQISVFDPGIADPTLLVFTGGGLEPGASCFFDVVLDVPSAVPAGTYTNSTSAITGELDTCNDGCFEAVQGLEAQDDLVIVGAPLLRKEFLDDPAQPGGTVSLQFTLAHDELATGDAVGVSFTDDLATVLVGLAGTGLPLADLCGPGNGSLSGSIGDTLLTVSGITLVPGEICSFTVLLSVPADADPGSVGNTTSNVSATVNGVETVGNAASDDLHIAGLVLSKEFLDDPVVPGDTVTLRFTIENLHPSEDATDITFEDLLDPFVLDGLSASLPPVPDPPCGVGSSLSTFDPPDQFGGTVVVEGLRLDGGSLLAGGSCTFDVTLTVPASTPSDTYTNSTCCFPATFDFEGKVLSRLVSGFSATMVDTTLFFADAIDTLVVNGDLLALTKEFTDDPVAPGGTVTLEFRLTNLSATDAVTDISFTDDLDAVLSGLEVVSALFDDCGGVPPGFPASLFSYSGTSLGAGESCTISFGALVPASATPGIYPNTTSTISGMVGGFEVSGDPASDSLRVESVSFTKSFAGPVLPGGTTTLSFVLENANDVEGIDGLDFTDDLDAVLGGLVALGLPLSDVCGAGSSLSGTSLLAVSGATLAPGGSCTFDVTVQVPLGASPGLFVNTTSPLSRSGLEQASPAVAELEVLPITCFTGPTATGAGDATICTAGGGATCGFDSVSFIALAGDLLSPPLGSSPRGVEFPFGLTAFTLDNCDPGFTALITLTLPEDAPAGTQYWKYGPTAGNNTPHWYVYPATIAGNEITFEVTDGGDGDSDLAEDGSLTDPSGPGVLAQSVLEIPTLGGRPLALLALLLAFGAVVILSRRSA